MASGGGGGGGELMRGRFVGRKRAEWTGERLDDAMGGRLKGTLGSCGDDDGEDAQTGMGEGFLRGLIPAATGGVDVFSWVGNDGGKNS